MALLGGLPIWADGKQKFAFRPFLFFLLSWTLPQSKLRPLTVVYAEVFQSDAINLCPIY